VSFRQLSRPLKRSRAILLLSVAAGAAAMLLLGIVLDRFVLPHNSAGQTKAGLGGKKGEIPAHAEEKTDNQVAVLAGEWNVTFPGGYVRVYKMEKDGTVSHTAADGRPWKGKVTWKDGMLVLYFEGGSAIERLRLGVDGRLFCEYWDPKADFPDKPAHKIGIGVRQK
jgi:hypothetical protein